MIGRQATLGGRDPRFGPRRFVAAVVLLVLASGMGCRRQAFPGAASPATHEPGAFRAWFDLTPVVDVADTHADRETQAVLRAAAKQLRAGEVVAADRTLSAFTRPSGQAWVTVARADLAVLHFESCLRGLAWRLPKGAAKTEAPACDRRADLEPGPGDVSIEATLTSIDEVVRSPVPELAMQARIARARITAWVTQCPATEAVLERAERVLEADLAALAAEGRLTPDLAFVWGTIQHSRYSGAAARPFFVAAKAGGYDDPMVTYALATIALELGELDHALAQAKETLDAFSRGPGPERLAEVHHLLGRIYHAKKELAAARRAYDQALSHVSDHPGAVLAITRLEQERAGPSAAATYLAGVLRHGWGRGALDEAGAEAAAKRLEAMVVLVEDDEVAQVFGEALLDRIESEADPLRRGLRYFFAATLEARQGELELARGHAVLAKDEFSSSPTPPPVDVASFLAHLEGAP